MHADSILRRIRHLFSPKADASSPDADLLRRFAHARDEAAFELLVWRHGALVLHVCRQMLRDEHAAEDAFQATFLVLFRKAGSILHREALPGWLHRVAFRVARRAGPGPAARTGLDLDGVPAPAPDEGEADTHRLLHEEIARLPAKYRLPIVCCYLEGKTHEQAASELGWPKGTVAGRLARARGVLHTRLARPGVTLVGLGLASHLSASTLSAGMTPRIAALLVALRAVGPSALSPSVVVLAEGVVNAMFWKSMQWVAVVVVLIGGLSFGGGLWAVRSGVAQDTKPREGREAPRVARDDKPAGVLEEGKPEDPLKEAENRARARRDLRTLAQAMQKYEFANSHLPAPAICDKAGKPLLSWRVTLLPSLGEDKLYKQFRMDEAWDGPHNKELLAKMPRVFMPVGVKPRVPNLTFYQVFVGTGAVFDDNRLPLKSDLGTGAMGGLAGMPHATRGGPLTFRDIPNNTILIAEAGVAVPWTKPGDIPYEATKPLPALGGQFASVINVAYADGSVHSLPKTLSEATIRARISRAGEQVDSLDDIPGGPDDFPARRKFINGLRSTNAKLKEAATILTDIIGEAKVELKSLRWTFEQEKMLGADPDAKKLKAENEALEKSIKEGRDEARKLMQELRELKEAMRKKSEK